MKKIWLLLLITGIFIQCSLKSQNNQAHIIRHLEIYAQPHEYCAWPSIIRAGNGDLLVTFCRSEEHLGPNGAILMMRSKDNGQTWAGPETIYDTILDDREAGIMVLRDGTIISHFHSTRFTKDYYEKLPTNSYEQSVLDKWIAHVEKDEYKNAVDIEGSGSAVSADNGYTWSGKKKGPDSVHGGIELMNGTVLVAAYRGEQGNIGIFSAKPPELNWERLTTFICPQIDTVRFGEPHLLQLPSGRILMMIRSTAVPYNDLGSSNHLWETYSDDNGLTWAEPFETPIWGFPPHLLLLSDNRVLCSYGYRKPPFGQRACISDDGITWKLENEVILRDDAFNKDLGYPASVELEPGVVLTVYYQPDPKDGDQRMSPPDPNRSRPDILGTIWRVPKAK